MKESGNFPLGAEFDPEAPYNEKINNPLDVDVDVSIILHKRLTVSVDDYDIDNGEVSFDECNLKGSVNEQKILPNESYKYINGNTKKGKKAISDLKGWDIEDIKIER